MTRQVDSPSLQYDRNILKVVSEGDILLGGTLTRGTRRTIKFNLQCLKKENSLFELSISLTRSRQALSIMFDRDCAGQTFTFIDAIFNFLWLLIKTAVVIAIAYFAYTIVQTKVLPRVITYNLDNRSIWIRDRFFSSLGV